MESLFLLVLSMLAVESADSIQLLYKHFLSKVTEKSLNAFYYACSYAKIDCCKFMNVTARLALQIIPNWVKNCTSMFTGCKSLRVKPVFPPGAIINWALYNTPFDEQQYH